MFLKVIITSNPCVKLNIELIFIRFTFKGIIYGGFESSTESIGILARWNATDLTLIGYTEITQNGMPWVAIDPSTRLLYSAVWNDYLSLQVYNVDTFEHVSSSWTTERNSRRRISPERYLSCCQWKLLNLSDKPDDLRYSIYLE